MPVDPNILADLPLFRGLSTVELEELCSYLSERAIGAKERIMREGDSPGHPIYILLRGTVEVVKGGINGRQHVITSLSAPSVFGEIEVLAKRPAIAGVVATTEVALAELARGDFDQMLNASRTAALKVVKNLAQTLSYRLAATDEQLAAHFDAGDTLAQAEIGLMRSVLYAGWRPD